jgi:hypothetical protein
VSRDDLVVPHLKEYREKKPAKRLRASHGNRVPKDTVRALWKRAGWKCEGRTPDCWGPPEHPHHRRIKGQGVDHRLLNLLAVCGGCHRFIHAHVDWSQRHGLILARGDDPELRVIGCDLTCDIDHRAPQGRQGEDPR